MLAFQLYVDADNLGALNLYGSQPHAFGEESEDVGLLFAGHAAVAFADAQKLDQINRAILSRNERADRNRMFAVRAPGRCNAISGLGVARSDRACGATAM